MVFIRSEIGPILDIVRTVSLGTRVSRLGHRPRPRMRRGRSTPLVVLLVALLALASCSRPSVPKPYGYYRIAIPDTAYAPLDHPGAPYAFDLSRNALAAPVDEPGEQWWLNINYPALNATVHCSYKPVRRNLNTLTADAVEFVYKHAQQATAIPEREFANPDARVYGVFFHIQGNTASPYQFFLTDSARHFFRGAVYCNTTPNADSLAPVYDYLRTDIEHLIESFRWTD